jgi:hypothetical protein
MGCEWDPAGRHLVWRDPPWWRWRWRCWRAAHYAWAADLNYRRWPSARNRHAYLNAVDYLHRVEANRP